MTFPLIIFLYVFYIFLTVWAIFCLVAIYHMVKFGFKNFITFLTTFIFIAVAALLLQTCFYFINQIDWQIRISVMEELFNNKLEY